LPLKSAALLFFIGAILFALGIFIQNIVVNAYLEFGLFLLIGLIVYPLLAFFLGITSFEEVKLLVKSVLKRQNGHNSKKGLI